MDNFATHKIKAAREIIEKAGAKVLYLPPYSPDLNPIEMIFAKIKAMLRKAGERTIDAVCNTLLQFLLPLQILAHESTAFKASV